MDSINDDWSRCPICFEDYSSLHRPTTFSCGHSICIDHVTGFQKIRNCPICRHELRPGNEYHVSYNLEDAARFYQLIKNQIDLSTSDTNVPRDSIAEMIHNDEIYARRLQAELNRGHRTAQINRENRTIERQRPENSIGNRVEQVTRPTGIMKTCNHTCDLVSTNQCCTCSDRRPITHDGKYDTYVDGVGTVNRARRNEFYCSTCKKR